MKKRWIYCMSIAFLLMIWLLLYIVIDHHLILPSPLQVFTSLFNIMTQIKYIKIILYSTIRLITSVVIAAVIGITCGMLSSFNQKFQLFIKPYVTILRTIPVISIVVILLILLGFTWTPYVITFFMIFPIVYQGTLQGMRAINPELIDVIKLEERHFIHMIFEFYIPQIKPYIYLTFLQSFGLGLKVLVMAEYLSQTKHSIGNRLYVAKINIMYDEIFAWTVILILIAIFIEWMIEFRMQKLKKEEDEKCMKLSSKKVISQN